MPKCFFEPIFTHRSHKDDVRVAGGSAEIRRSSFADLFEPEPTYLCRECRYFAAARARWTGRGTRIKGKGANAWKIANEPSNIAEV